MGNICADSRLASQSIGIDGALSSVRPSVTIVHGGQTMTDRVMISTQNTRASTWLHHAPNSIEIGQALFEQWLA
jgi:hypothetical protein